MADTEQGGDGGQNSLTMNALLADYLRRTSGVQTNTGKHKINSTATTMVDTDGRDDDFDPKGAAEKVAADAYGDDEKKQKPKGVCRGCGTTEDLTACFCFTPPSDSPGCECGTILCSQCAKDDTRCERCKQLICSADTTGHDDDCTLDYAFICGYHEGYDTNCDAAICVSCIKESEWDACFCGHVKFCPSCSLTGDGTFHHCNTCKTLYCNDEKGDCGRDCNSCRKTLCCKCLGVDDPRSLDYCAGCKPTHSKKRPRGDRNPDYYGENPDYYGESGYSDESGGSY